MQNAPTVIPLTKNVDGINNFKNPLFYSEGKCDIPCFLSIIPETTTMEDVESILDEYLDFPCVDLFPNDVSENIIKCSLAQYDSYLYVSADHQTGLVDWLTYSPSLNSPVYLENLIEIYGAPDSMSAVALPDERDVYIVCLFYDTL